MKVKLSCKYGDKTPGEIVDIPAEKAKKMIDMGAAAPVAAAKKGEDK